MLASLAVTAGSVTNVNIDNYGLLVANFKRDNAVQVAIFSANWCPDCQSGKPNIDACKAAALTAGINVLNSDVGTRDQWRLVTNPFKTDTLYKISAVPSVLLVKDGAIIASIIEDQIFDESAIANLIDAVNKNKKVNALNS